VWREIWDQVGPRAESAMLRNEGTYDEALLLIMERNGYPEETYYTFSYSPVPNDEGGVGGILCANTDDTQRIIGERRLTLLRDLAARTSDARTPEEVCAQASRSLETNLRDLPFALIYLRDRDGAGLSRAAASGIAPGHQAAPQHLGADGSAIWPFERIMGGQRSSVVDNLSERFENLPLGIWSKRPAAAVMLPIASTGETGRNGVLIVGLSPYRLFDDQYESFLGLVAGQIAASVANAEAYEAEKQRAEALAELDHAKTTFFSNVSHEFRTPLTLMLSPIQDMLERAAPGDPSRETIELLHRNALRLLKLVNTLLDFARIEANRVQAVYQPTDLAALTADLASNFRAASERAGLTLVVRCEPLPEPAYVDQDMWEKIVLNLISNAFKFTFGGSITVELTAARGEAVLAVSDTGTGISEHEQPKLFERFHRIEGARSRSHEGSGIGLALVRELVRMHGGSVNVKSKPGEGSTFTVRIPLGIAHLAEGRIRGAKTLAPTALGATPFVEETLRWLPASSSEPATLSIPDELGGGPPGPANREDSIIAIADDNADMRDYLSRLLGQRWHVRVFGDGRAALEGIAAERPDLVVTDVMMPNLDGFGLLQALRQNPLTRVLPVILLSARAGESARVEGVQAGADDYIVKPFSARELVARVAAQLELSRLRGIAEAERAKLRQIFLDAPAYIAMYRGPDHVIDFVNRRWESVRGVDRAALIGLPLAAAVPSRADTVPILDGVFRTGETFSTEERVWHADWGQGPEDRFFSWTVQPTRDPAGNIDGVMSLGVDVTELVSARNRLAEQSRIAERARSDAEAARSEAETATRAKDEFLAMLGHELRNPLSPMLTALQLMRLRGETAMLREREVLERQVKHLTRLVEDLLDVSRITRGKIALSKERIELSGVVARAVEMASPLIEQRAHHLSVDVPETGCIVEADPVRLAQVISNLLNNAATYTRAGGRIAIEAARENGEVVTRVRDSGDGIPPELLPRVFDFFAQGGRSIDRSLGGLGIGLSIVRSLVTLHGGSVTAHSEGLGRGSEFVVRLPRSEALAPASNAAPAGAAEAPKRRVLVVDDNRDAAETLAEALTELGSTVEFAFDGPSAIERALAFRPDVALLDIGLPVMDGYEVARRLRAEPALTGIKLVAITGYGQQSDRDRAVEAGFDLHVVKPIELAQLPTILAGSSPIPSSSSESP
jgi:PAS domain S-box-containing protein